jgi:hypothetical protein
VPGFGEELMKVQVGDVVQIDPELPHCFFRGCFMLVTEVRSWGAIGFIAIPGSSVRAPAQAWFRCETAHLVRIGPAAWKPATSEKA